MPIALVLELQHGEKLVFSYSTYKLSFASFSKKRYQRVAPSLHQFILVELQTVDPSIR